MKLENIVKTFPGVKALSDMHIELEQGEVHAVVGENGAGKSTLMKVLAGVYQPTSGKIYFNEEEVSFSDPNDAYNSGIAIIFQETSLFKDMTVLENMFIGHEYQKKHLGFVKLLDKRKMEERAFEIFKFLGISNIPLSKKIDRLGAADKQIVEIAKALTYDAKVLILDEPTSSLTNKEVKALFDLIGRLKENRVSMLYITHRMEEIFQIADRVTVIRDGSYISTSYVKDIAPEKLISDMVGREIDNMYLKFDIPFGETVLEVKNLTKYGLLEDINFEVKAGEIVGFAGLSGSGRTEIAECICGLMNYQEGEVLYNGKPFVAKNYRHAIDSGMLYLSEDRKKYGLVLEMSVRENALMKILYKITNRGLLKEKKEIEMTEQLIKDFQIKTPSTEFIVENLSGGNQQKVLVAKSVCANPTLLIMDEPTRGVDVATKSAIHSIVGELAKKGLAVILISSDMPELLRMSDRIVVIKDGKKRGELVRDEFSQDKVLAMAL